MGTAAESESQWTELQRLSKANGELRLALERLELLQAGTYDAVMLLHAKIENETAARAAADETIATRAADAIVAALRTRLDNRSATIAALTSITAQTVAYIFARGFQH
jgi:hypothetical protein